MNTNEMISKRNEVLAKMRSFLDSHDGVLSAEDDGVYQKMEADLDAYDKSIERSRKLDAMNEELDKPVNQVLSAQPAKPAKTEKPGRASDEYKAAFWDVMKAKPMTSTLYNALQIGTATEGGYLVPEEFERTLIDKLNEDNVLRKIATVIKTDGDRKIPVIASHGSASIIAEEGAYTESDDSFTQVVLGAFKIGTMMKVSEELMNDSAFNLQNYITSEFARRCGAAEENYFINGTGSGQPVGLLAATGGAATGVTAAAANAITADELIDLLHSVREPYRRKGAWLLNDTTVKYIRKLKTGDGQYLWQPALTAGTPSTLLNYPIYTTPYMPSVASGNKTVAFGDFSYFWIADRSDFVIQRLNELYAANGQVGFRGFERVDGKLILDEAIKVLKQA